MSAQKLLVTGASGKMGKWVIEYLLNELNVAPNQLVATSRNVDKLTSIAAKGVEVREADFANPSSLDTAFKGIDNLLLVSMDAVGERDKMHTNAVKAAEKAGVKHITYTSMPSADSSPLVFAFEHNATEQAIADSSIPHFTVLRNNWYFENLSEFFASTLQTNVWLTAAAEGLTAQIGRKDLALAAATSLVKAAEGKQTLTLNGPESLSINEMAIQINSVIGTNINVVHVSDNELKAQLESYHIPEGVVSLITTMDIHNRENHSAGSSDEFEALTGYKPQAFTGWLQDNCENLQAVASQKSLA